MATLGLDEDELKSIEQTLSRLSQLSSSIQSFKADILKSNPLPHPSSLQASAQIIQRNLQTVLDSVTENNQVLSRMAVHPSTNFPGRTQENVLTQLLRKKLEPDVEELVGEGQAIANATTAAGMQVLQQVWDEVRAWTHARIASHVRDEAGDVYTREEREAGVETVRTGLRRVLDEESEDGDDEDDEMAGGEGAQPTGPEIETLLWFASRGDFELPRHIEFERKTGPLKRGLEGVNIPPQDAAVAGMGLMDESA
ncbi:hypothetical protein CDD82_4678 [Ophiocordyceps australis]|uniref:Mediator of RNA polymerase II transcription subunit 8 n=1 Tax=Ophiocordyceps australis TaxID=1399860 RepID=A0A2C5ZUM7_9HYPO|nr:hypothetical protein CDD82_4678 [Ophiocordyceps australis]